MNTSAFHFAILSHSHLLRVVVFLLYHGKSLLFGILSNHGTSKTKSLSKKGGFMVANLSSDKGGLLMFHP